MIEIVCIICLTVSFVGFLVFHAYTERMHFVERDRFTNKILSRDFPEYAFHAPQVQHDSHRVEESTVPVPTVSNHAPTYPAPETEFVEDLTRT